MTFLSLIYKVLSKFLGLNKAIDEQHQHSINQMLNIYVPYESQEVLSSFVYPFQSLSMLITCAKEDREKTSN